MMRVGMTVLREDPESALSPHFAKAKWLLVCGEEDPVLRRNESLRAREVVEAFEAAGCSDVICAALGPGALRHLEDAGIRAWYGPEGVPAGTLLGRLERGELARALEAHPADESAGGPEPGAGRRHRHRHGPGCRERGRGCHR
ncbi:MAG: NifB/NifX family molybdenum-iron cluster-binding protein [Acidobacteriota bacterium]|jgi:predicted Fe-Mo cluster-binding NifX family protein